MPVEIEIPNIPQPVQPSTKQIQIKAQNNFLASDENTDLRFPLLAQFNKELAKKELTLDFINIRRPNFQSNIKNEPPHVNTLADQFGQPLSETRQLPAFQSREPESTAQGFQFNTLPI